MASERKKIEHKSAAFQTYAAKPQDFANIAEPKEISPLMFSAWIRKLLQNWRQGTVGVKGRADVSLSGKKPWKQKGTGRARAGTAKSPLWRKGGVIHGPQPRVRTLKINKKQKSGVLHNLFWHYLEQGKIHIVQHSFDLEKPQTALAGHLLSQLDLAKAKVALLLDPKDVLIYSSFMNLPNVHIVYFDELNGYDLANAHSWLMLEKDIPTFKEMVSRWL